jgi:hypothetical protein
MNMIVNNISSRANARATLLVYNKDIILHSFLYSTFVILIIYLNFNSNLFELFVSQIQMLNSNSSPKINDSTKVMPKFITLAPMC